MFARNSRWLRTPPMAPAAWLTSHVYLVVGMYPYFSTSLSASGGPLLPNSYLIGLIALSFSIACSSGVNMRQAAANSSERTNRLWSPRITSKIKRS